MGRFEYSNGNLFTGAWEKDMKLGFGTLKWANGDEYTGEWKDNKMCPAPPCSTSTRFDSRIET